MAAWHSGAVSGAASASPGTAFTRVPGAVPAGPSVAVAAGGRALIAGRDCDTCAVTVRERAAGGAFGDATPVPGTDGLKAYAAALASDGAALIAGSKGGQAVAFERPAGTWSAPIDLGADLPNAGAPAVGVGRGGSGVVRVIGEQGLDVRVHELAGDGTAGRVTTYPNIGFDWPQVLAVADDGAAAVLTPSGLIQRAAGQPFGAPVPTDAGTVALGPAGPLLGAVSVRTYDVTYGGVRTAVAPLPVLPPGSGLPPFPKPGRVRVPSGPVRTDGRFALVPLLCGGARRQCQGTVGTDAFSVSSGGGRYVLVPAGGHVTRVHFDVRQGKRTRHLTRQISRGPDRRACQLRPWARVLARSGPYRLAVESRDVQPDIVACGPGVPRRVVGAGYPVAADIRDGRLAYVVDNRLETLRGGSGRVESHRLFTGSGRTVRALRLTADGAVALVDRVDTRVRIRVVHGTADRLLDFGPGVDPKSLTVDGNTVSWTRDGALQSATV